MPDIGDEGMEAANHITMYVPMQQSCMFCTRTPEAKVQYKNIYIYKLINSMHCTKRIENKIKNHVIISTDIGGLRL